MAKAAGLAEGGGLDLPRMDRARLLAVCVEALEGRRKAYAFEANLLLKSGLDERFTRRAARRYLEYSLAIVMIQEVLG